MSLLRAIWFVVMFPVPQTNSESFDSEDILDLFSIEL